MPVTSYSRIGIDRAEAWESNNQSADLFVCYPETR